MTSPYERMLGKFKNNAESSFVASLSETRKQEPPVVSPDPIDEAASPTPREIEEIEVVAIPEDASSAEVEQAIQRSATDFKRLMNEPLPGSLLHYVNMHKTGMQDIEAYISEQWLPKIGSIIWDDGVDFWTYFLYSTVLPHGRAVSIAETVAQATKEKGLDNWALLTAMTGFSIKGRQDLGSVLRAMGRRTPKLWSTVMQLSQMASKRKFKFKK